MKHFDVVTIFPEMFDALVDHGITRRALDEKRFELKAWNPRDFTQDNYRRVDDRPFGGGPGMVMQPAPLEACIEAAKARQRQAGVSSPHVVLHASTPPTNPRPIVAQVAPRRSAPSHGSLPCAAPSPQTAATHARTSCLHMASQASTPLA